MKIQKKYDFLMIFLYLLIIAICSFMVIFPLVTINKVKVGILDVVFMVLSTLVMTYFIYNFISIRYYYDDKHLFIRSATTRTALRMKNIVEVNKKNKIFCSTITARKCLEIVYSPYGTNADLRYFYISCKNEDEVIKMLKERCKHLKTNL